MMLTNLLISLSLLCTFSTAYKIGIFTPVISGSQVVFNQRVAETLADAGHDVTLIHLVIFKDVQNTKLRSDIQRWEIDALPANLDMERIKTTQAKMAFGDENIFKMLLSSEGKKAIERFTKHLSESCEKLVTNKKALKKIEDAKFDILFTHMYDFCSIGVQHVVKAPTWAWLNSGALMDYVAILMGLQLPPSYAAPMMSDASDNMTFVQRAKSVIGHSIALHFIKKMSGTPQTAIFRKQFGDDFPHLLDIAKTAPLIFVNSNELYDLPRPTLHKIVNIGGLGMTQATSKPLPEDIKKLVDAADSVVVFTFGSVADATKMPEAWKRTFMEAFSRLPNVQVFMRYPGTDMDSYKPKNVYLSKWLPQVDLLQHSKTKVFLTHGGFNGMQEAFNSGTPMITIPLFGDQYRNSRIAEKHGFGIVLHKANINADNVVRDINTILNDDTYDKAAKRMNAMVQQKPIPPEQLLVRWTEFLAEFKTLDNLRPVGADLDFITLYNVDVYATFAAVLITILLIVFFVGKFILTRVARLACRVVRGGDHQKNE